MKIRQSEPVFCSQKISSWRRKSCKQFPPGALQVAKNILRTCDTPSATCNVFQSSSLRDKLQEKLPRVTWPIGRNGDGERGRSEELARERIEILAPLAFSNTARSLLLPFTQATFKCALTIGFMENVSTRR